MHVCFDIPALRHIRQQWQMEHKTVAFVPTMGNLHAGHRSLIQQAKQTADKVVTSIFVNPLQFGVNEDFGQYPRTMEADRQACEQEGVDLIFAPHMDDVHPALADYVQLRVPGISDELCGKSRPPFFYGISTVVAKLFNLVQPHVAIFGEKDFQQFMVIQRMVQELHFPITLISAPIVREADGLAMSSRNQYLSVSERQLACQLYQHLTQLRDILEFSTASIQQACQMTFERLEALGFTMDYLEARRLNDFRVADAHDKQFKIVLACWLGKTRLIDNITVQRP